MNTREHHPYRIEGELTVTRLNTILWGVDRQTNRQLIIKTPNSGMCQPHQHTLACEELAHEWRILRELATAGIPSPRAVAFLHLHGRPHLFLRRVPGENLQTLFDHGQLRTEDVLAAVIDVAATLARIHEFGYVHGDVKPANIVLRPDRRAVLIDWGAAVHLDHPLPKRYSFTQEFASNEHIRGIVHTSNDVYALGRTLDALVPCAGARVVRIILTATAPLEQRYQDGTALYAALKRLWIIEQIARSFDATVLCG